MRKDPVNNFELSHKYGNIGTMTCQFEALKITPISNTHYHP